MSFKFVPTIITHTSLRADYILNPKIKATYSINFMLINISALLEIIKKIIILSQTAMMNEFS